MPICAFLIFLMSIKSYLFLQVWIYQGTFFLYFYILAIFPLWSKDKVPLPKAGAFSGLLWSLRRCSSRIFLVVIHVRVEHRVPDRHESWIVSDILGMMEDVIRGICAKRNNPEDAPWQLIATMWFMWFQDSKDAPVHNCPNVHFGA